MLHFNFQYNLNKFANNKHVPLFFAFIIFVMIILTFLSFLSIFKKKLPSEKINQISTQRKMSEKQQIVQHHLFGEFLESSTSIEHEAPTHLSLQAIFYSQNPVERSSVLISENNALAKLYYINDTLSNGIKIQNILADKVILNDGGKLQILKLHIPKLDFSAPPENTLP